MPWCPQCRIEYRVGFERCSDCGSLLTAEPPASVQEVEPGPEWVSVGGYTTEEEARLARGLLDAKGILAAVVNRHVVLYPFPETDTADVLLLVCPEDADRADRELTRAEAGEDEIDDSDVAEEEPAP